jgi:hypothetical protein
MVIYYVKIVRQLIFFMILIFDAEEVLNLSFYSSRFFYLITLELLFLEEILKKYLLDMLPLVIRLFFNSLVFIINKVI